MISLRVSGLMLAFCCACQAAEIVAWKNGLEKYLPGGLEENEAVKLASPPEPSVFFEKGDELWDVSKRPPYWTHLKSEWLVWNATSQRLVMKGSAAEIGLFQQTVGPESAPHQLRILAEVFQTADGKPVAEGATPSFSFSMNTRSEVEFERELETPEWRIEWKGTATFDRHRPIVHLLCDLKLLPKDQPDLRVKTSMTSDSGKSLWLASDDDGKTGIHVRITPMIERLDRVPREEVIMIQRGNGRKSIIDDRKSIAPVTLPEGGMLLSKCDLGELMGFTKEVGKDPFAQGSESPASDPVVPAYKEIVAPAFLSKLTDEPLLDVRSVLQGHGVNLTEEDFAGYHPLRDRIYVYTTDSEKMNATLYLLSPELEMKDPAVMGFAIEGKRRSYLVGRSGMKQSLERRSGDEHILFVEIEPVLGVDGDAMDLILGYHHAGNSGIQRIKTSTWLENGRPAVVVERTSDSNPGLRVTGKNLNN